MPSIQAGAKVLVTGCNGYIAMQTVKVLLEHNYHVRGTVRGPEKVQSVLECFPEYINSGKLEVVAVGDLTKEGVFNDAVKDVDGVIHIASPVILAANDPAEVIEPAVRGTLGILESSLHHGTSIKRVVIVASISTISQVSIDLGDVHAGSTTAAPRIFSEEDCNEESVGVVETVGKDAPPLDKYQAAKVGAEKAAWKFVDEHRNEIGWDIVTTHPGYVFGPFINKWESLAAANLIMQIWHGVIFGTNTEALTMLGNSSGGYVDVRDVSLAHVRALERSEAGGERFLLTSDDVANDLVPSPKLNMPIAPKRNLIRNCLHLYNRSKAENILDIKFRSKEEITRDTLEDWARLGW